jgi:hypothetical protein
MTLQHTPTPARSDVTGAPTHGPSYPFRRHGLLLTSGALAWAASIAALGLDGDRIEHAAGGLFQLGVLALVRVLWRTRALGEGRLARGVLRLETGILLGAMVSTLGDATGIGDLDQLFWILMDACWPFSKFGMFLIGIRIAVAGRWNGLSRWWPMVAESWAVVTIPAMIVAGDTGAQVVGSLHLVVGYAVLGLLVARKQA